MTYLREALVGAFGDLVGSYSGEGGAIRSGSGWTKASKEEVTTALRKGRTQVLICTDAASEGLNLQAASALVNYDLPWNPSKVEQRIGRIDRIGQVLSVLPIVNFYLKGSVDERVYQTLALRCGLFERFVGPMQPVLSRALRMLIGRERFDEAALTDLVHRIEGEPAIAQAFHEAEPVSPQPEPLLVRPEHTQALLAALDRTGVEVRAETAKLSLVDCGPLRIASDGSAVASHPDVAIIDGLDARQWALLRRLQRPGDQLPLVVTNAVKGGFRSIACAWLPETGHMIRPSSLDEVAALVAAWQGYEPPADAVAQTRRQLNDEVHRNVVEAFRRVEFVDAQMVQAQRAAARLRLQDELGRTLACFDPETDDLNGKLHRLMQDRTPTAERLREVFRRLGDYPKWDAYQVAEIRDFRDKLSPAQVKTRVTGRELEAALADPRWIVQTPAPAT